VAGEGRLGEETNGNLSRGRSRFFKDRSAIQVHICGTALKDMFLEAGALVERSTSYNQNIFSARSYHCCTTSFISLP
jgi:hypothetical protein